MKTYFCYILGHEETKAPRIEAETPEQAAEEAVRNHCGFNGIRLGEHHWRVEVRQIEDCPLPSRIGIFTVSLQFSFKAEKA